MDIIMQLLKQSSIYYYYEHMIILATMIASISWTSARLCVSVIMGRNCEIEKCKYDVDRFWRLLSNDVIAKIVLRDLDLLFECHKF